MAGVQDQIGIGQAQVLPKPESMMPLADQLNEQKRYKDQQVKYEQARKEQNDKELYGLVGDALNLRDFNPVIHDRVKKAQIELAQKIKSEKPSYADTYLLAQNKAAELGQMSTGLNDLDKQIALTKKEYESDKRINTGAVEMIARKKALDDLNTNGKVDPSKNYFDEALNEYPQFALADDGGYTVYNFLPEEKQQIGGKYKAVNRRGGYDQFDWKAETYPVFYDVKDNGEDKAPTITTKSQPSGLLDANKKPIPMLSDDAYGRFKSVPSNVIDINRRLQKQYGSNLDLKSQEAETLRKIEAYKDVEAKKPRINPSRIEKADPIKIYNNNGHKPTQKEIEAGTPLSLKQYGVEGDSYDVTPLASGIKVTGLPTGQSLAVKKLLFNPDTKEVTYTDQLGNTKKSDFETFRQDIATLNTGVDLSFIDRLKVTGRPTKNEPAKTSSKMVIMVLPDGKKGQIPEDKIAEFMKDNPKAKRQ
jgi:hypothetical protein